MIMKVVNLDGSWFVGKRTNKEIGFIPHETKGTHHFTVLDGDAIFSPLIGWEIAIPIVSVKYFILNFKFRKGN